MTSSPRLLHAAPDDAPLETPRTPVERFASLLRRHRLAAALSQNKLARLAGIDPAYVNRIERQQQQPPQRPVILRLADACELSSSATDRLLFAAGYAPEVDWQRACEHLQERLLALMRTAAEDALAEAIEIGIQYGHAP